jgi:hypothetical protein
MSLYAYKRAPSELCVPAKKYTAEHESVTFDDTTGLGTIRITEHAQDALGDVVFVELPAVGTQVSQGGMFLLVYFLSHTRYSHSPRPNWRGRERKGRFRHRTIFCQLHAGLFTQLIHPAHLVCSGFWRD